MGLHDRLRTFLAQDTHTECTATRRGTIARTREAIEVIEEAFTRYRDDEIAISYNGGKDCLVLLVLLMAVLESRTASAKTKNRRIKTVYVAIKDPFDEVDAFVNESAETYGLDVVTIQKPMKEAFADYLVHHPSIRAILVGTRRNDPHGSNLSFFDPTDQGWPKFMRIHPIINWQYGEIWDFLKSLEIPYCVLYDRGYTSLGGTSDTLPNPRLQQPDASSGSNGHSTDQATESVRYRPAWQLESGEEERMGRDKARETPSKDVKSMNYRTSVDFGRSES